VTRHIAGIMALDPQGQDGHQGEGTYGSAMTMIHSMAG